jgi:hypothetical protein
MKYFTVFKQSMSDEKPATVQSGGIYGSAAGVAFILMLTVFLFYWIQTSKPSFAPYLYIATPITFYIIAFCGTLAAQHGACGSINAGSAALASVYTLGYIVLGYIISSFEFVRSPIASMFYDGEKRSVRSVESDMSDTYKTDDGKEHKVTFKGPMIKTFAVAYYVFFLGFIGQTSGGGMAIKC